MAETAQESSPPLLHALVAQGIEHRSPKAGVAGSNPAEGTYKAPGHATLLPRFGNKPISFIKNSDVEKFVTELLAHKSVGTVRKALYVLRPIFNSSIKDGLIQPPNPCDFIEAPTLI